MEEINSDPSSRAAQVQDWPSHANGIEPYVRLEESNVSCVQGLVVRLLFHELLRHLLLLIYQSNCGRATLYSRLFICSRNRFSCFDCLRHSHAHLCWPAPLCVDTLFPPDFPLTPYFLQHFLPPISFPAESDFINQQHARLEHPLRCHLGPPRPPLRLPLFWYSPTLFMSEPLTFTRSLMA